LSGDDLAVAVAGRVGGVVAVKGDGHGIRLGSAPAYGYAGVPGNPALLKAELERRVEVSAGLDDGDVDPTGRLTR
jgi:hypothetical protein